MITEHEAGECLIRAGVRCPVILYWLDGGSAPLGYVKLGTHRITLNLRRKLMSIHVPGDGYRAYTHNWVDWFRFDETDIEFRGVDLTWWCNHKPALLELTKLIESKFSKPGNCRPDICPQ